jgi:hypothetical protein
LVRLRADKLAPSVRRLRWLTLKVSGRIGQLAYRQKFIGIGIAKLAQPCAQ